MANSMATRWDSIAKNNKYKWTYDIAMAVRAIYLSDEKKYEPFLHQYVDYFIASDGTISSFSREDYNIDRVLAGRNLFYLYKITKDPKYKKAIEYQIEQINL